MRRVTSSTTLVRNTLTNGLAGVLGTALGILLAPFLIGHLGLEAYGVWTLALALSFAGGYAALSDLGIEAATVRFLAEAWADDAMDDFSRIVATSFAFFAAVGAVLAVGVVLAASAFVEIFSVGADLRSAARVAFLLVGLQLVLELPGRALAAVLEGTQRFAAYQAVELTKAVAFAAGTVVALQAGGGLEEVAGVYAGTSVVGFALFWFLAHRAVPGVHVGPWRASRVELRRLLGYGVSVFALRFVGTLYRQMDKIILGLATTPAVVALYEIANKLHLAGAQIQSMSVSALTPAAAQSRADAPVLRDMFVRGTLYASAISVPVALGAIIFAEPLLRDWIGREAEPAADAARLLLAFLLTTAFQGVGQTVLVALGKVRRVVQFGVGSLLLNLALSILLVGPLGLEGVVLGTLIAGIVWTVPVLALCLREFDVGLREWLVRIVVPHIPAVAVQALVGLGLLRAVDRFESLPFDALAVLASIAANLAVLVFVGLRHPDRHALVTTLRAALPGRRATVTVR